MKSINDITQTFDAIAAVSSIDRGTGRMALVTVEEEHIGKFWRQVRQTDVEPVSTRRHDDVLVARFDVEKEEEEEGLGELFG